MRKFTDYTTILLISPILLIMSSSVTVFITTQIKHMTASFDILNYVGPAIFLLIKMIPYLLVWLLLTMVYIIMPNTKVHFRSAFIAGIIAGTAYQLLQWGYINFQIGVSRSNAIYGSFAALPLFLIWLQLSWLIILTGAKIAYATQNAEKFESFSEKDQMSVSLKRMLSLLICHQIIQTFTKGEKALTLSEIAQNLNAPLQFVQQIVNELIECRLVSELKSLDKETLFQPAQDTNRLTISYIIETLENKGFDKIEFANTEQYIALNELTSNFKAAIHETGGNKLLREI